MLRWIACGLTAWVLVVGCSKENQVDSSKHNATGVGAQCSGAGDPGCGTQGVCVLGYCRIGCNTDSECPQGALCLGAAPPFGCSLSAELACDEQPCTPPLACGIDNKCRFPCKADTNCARNEHRCESGACVSLSEPGADLTWFSCEINGRDWFVRCTEDFAALSECNKSQPGWDTGTACGAGQLCVPVNDGLWSTSGDNDLVGAFCGCGYPTKAPDSAPPAAYSACKADPVCYGCLFHAQSPDCAGNQAYAALKRCGAGDGGSYCPGFAASGADCDTCVSTNCASECSACGGDQSCVEYLGCLSGLGCVDAACKQPCTTHWPSGAPLGETVLGCAKTKCSAACPSGG